jgi:hypothetical protein
LTHSICSINTGGGLTFNTLHLPLHFCGPFDLSFEERDNNFLQYAGLSKLGLPDSSEETMLPDPINLLNVTWLFLPSSKLPLWERNYFVLQNCCPIF